MIDRLREVAGRYDSVADPYATAWAPVLRALSEPALARVPVAGARLLDLGCGPGVVSRRLTDGGATLFGVDVSHEALRRAPFPVTRGDIEALPFAPSSFDAVLCTFVLQHTPWARRVIADARRVLRSGGVLATATWGADTAETAGPWEIAWAALEEADPAPVEGIKTWHGRVDAPHKLRRMARAVGFAAMDVWRERIPYRWERARFVTWARSHRVFSTRLASLPPEAQARVLEQLEQRIRAATDEQMVWTADVVFCVATKARS